MEYKVVPFVAQLGHKDRTAEAASQLESHINFHAANGWEYVRLESVDTFVAADPGCVGFGAKPAYNLSLSMIVFRKK